MKTVLAISYFYPPFDSTAALEASKLTSYLPDSGWAPVILSSESDFPASLPVELDETNIYRTRHLDVNALPKRVLSSKRGHYVSHLLGARSLAGRVAQSMGRAYRHTIDFPDGQIGWLPFAVTRGRALIDRYRPDLIFSIAGPFTSHLVANRLARATRIPWFADFRDLWTDNHHFRRARPLLYLERALECRTMEAASALSTATPAWADVLEAKHEKPTWFIPNGFMAGELPKGVRQSERFTLTYTGVFYRHGQDAAPLLDATARLHEARVIDATNFELRLVGRHVRMLQPEAHIRGISHLVSFHDPVSHAEALREQGASTALVFFLWTAPEGRGWLSAKVYEYMASRRPILAIGPADVDAADLVRSMGAGEVTGDRNGVERTLRRWIDEFRRTGKVQQHGNHDRLSDYEWRKIDERLAAAFDETIEGPSAARRSRAS